MSQNNEFINWLVEYVPYYNKLEQEEKNELKYYYNEVEIWRKTEQDILKNALYHNTSGINYANDFEKAGANRVRAQNNLDIYLDELAIKYGIINSEEQKVNRGR